MKKLCLCSLMCLWGTAVDAEVIKIPQESGLSGSLMAGSTYMDYSSNMFKGADDSNTKHDGLQNKPKENSVISPLFGWDLRYTFSSTKTQLFLGNLIQDAVRFDFTQQFGIRQQIDDKGILAASYVFPLMSVDTWADPYADGERNETEMTSGGARLSWDQIMGSNFNFNYTIRKFDIDSENSAESLLSEDKQALLNRNGKTKDTSLSYFWAYSDNNIISPELTYGVGDFDGKAMSYKKSQFKVSYLHNNKSWSFVSNIFGGKIAYEKVNPIFKKKADSNEFGINASFFLNNIFDIQGLSWFLSSSYAISDSDIDFYTQSVHSHSTGLLYRL